MHNQDALTWFEIPAADLGRATRFSEDRAPGHVAAQVRVSADTSLALPRCSQRLQIAVLGEAAARHWQGGLGRLSRSTPAPAAPASVCQKPAAPEPAPGEGSRAIEAGDAGFCAAMWQPVREPPSPCAVCVAYANRAPPFADGEKMPGRRRQFCAAVRGADAAPICFSPVTGK